VATRRKLPYSAGKRKGVGRPSSVVRVYRRKDLPDRLCYSCAWILTDAGRPRELTLPAGTTVEAACTFADMAAAEREMAIIEGRDSLGRERKPAVTLGALFSRYLASEEAARWSARHAADLKYSVAFWRLHLDVGAEVTTLTKAAVSAVAGREARKRGVGPRWTRKRLAHLRAAVLWGLDQAQLYEVNPLRGLRMPDYEPETDELIYSPEDCRLLWAPHPDIDWRVTLLFSVVADTGRRLSAILALTTEDLVTDGERALLRFRKEFDKGGKTTLVPVSEPTAALLADALERDLVQEWGWIFPEGRLDYDDVRDKPWGASAAIDALHKAEAVLGIETRRGRAYHGGKRLHVTASMEVSHGDTALVGDVTGNVSAELLRRVYRKANRGRTATHVDAVRKALEGGESTREPQRQDGAE
jgi:integrase